MSFGGVLYVFFEHEKEIASESGQPRILGETLLEKDRCVWCSLSSRGDFLFILGYFQLDGCVCALKLRTSPNQPVKNILYH